MDNHSLVPIGVTPEWIWRELRVQDLRDAINRYWDAGLQPDDRWITELNKHLNWLKELKTIPRR